LIDASVILCVRNGAGTIGAQLQALAEQDHPQEWELIVVDNGSSDGTTNVVEQWHARLPALRVVEANARTGLAYARNVGASAAAGRVLAFCDADDLAAPGWLAALIAGTQRADIVGGRLELESLNRESSRFWRSMSADDVSRPQALGYLPYAVGANFAVRRETFEAVGGCDEAFVTCGDDIDLSWRIQRAGGVLEFRDDAVMHYRLRQDLRGMMRQRYRYGQVDALLRRKFADAVPPVRWRERWLAYGYVLKRPWHLLADGRRRGLWLSTTSYCAGRIRGSIRYRVLFY
jgi:glycosyltransferase involved in cell wall biosynthesis